MENNKIEMSNYITLIKNNGSGAGMVGDGGDGLVSVGSGMVAFAHDGSGMERCNDEREGELAAAPVGGRGGFDDNGGGRWKTI